MAQEGGDGVTRREWLVDVPRYASLDQLLAQDIAPALNRCGDLYQ